ncbi:ABC transporter substrate-binding protein [Lunatimonas lonarensis]|uniref:ABC transporter substrate-binding protein n=1 Tax=Lunatimonas lonarensis TaxID=1232681 RepID=UPI00138AE4E8|nr:ABC transporter substrate-binding protein [Lunatimonas lonarensis]
MKPSSLFPLFFGVVSMLALACGQASKPVSYGTWEDLPLRFAKGFSVKKSGDNYWVEVLEAFPKADRSYHYLVIQGDSTLPDLPAQIDFDAIVRLPAETVAVTSTTHIPHLDMLGVTRLLGGFPGRELISSELQRGRIEANEVRELGTGASLNVESVMDLSPDWLMVSTVGNSLQQISVLSNAGIPIILNGDYVEGHPLGVAEWIKLTGILTGTSDQADQLFEEITRSYIEAQQLVKDKMDIHRPRVMSGVMYNDSWYASGSDSWASVLIEHAGGDYLFKENRGKGGLTLSYEYILDRAESADFWIGAADYPSRQALAKQDAKYIAFRPFQTGNIFTYTGQKGATGGLLYFELGYIRPDLVLKDLIKIMHPDLLPDYELFFYERIDERL